MTMYCKVCSSNQRVEIDREIVSSGNLARIAQKFDLPYNSLYNHAQNHVSRQLAQAWEKTDMTERHSLLNKIDSMLATAQEILDRNFQAGKDGLALKAIDSQRNTIDLLARISYNLHQAKLAELELQRKESGEDDAAIKEDYQQRLKILSVRELKMLDRLHTKLRTQNPNMRILPDDKDQFQDINDDDTDKVEPNIRNRNNSMLRRTKFPKQGRAST